MNVDRGIRLARIMGDHQRKLSTEPHQYAARVLYAISATSGTVSAEMARRWAADERLMSDEIADQTKAVECAHAAVVLDTLAIAIEANI